MGEGSYTLQNRRAALRQVWLSHVQLLTKQYAHDVTSAWEIDST